MKKLRSRLGFTLTETLIAVVLLGILAAGTAVASGSLISVRNGMIATADGEALGSTLMEALTHEVRYGQNITLKTVTFSTLGGVTSITSNEVDTLDSMTFGVGASFEADPVDGYVKVKSSSMTDGPQMLISESAYTNLKARNLKMVVDTSGNVTVSIEIVKGTDVIWTGEVTVTPLNGI